MKSHEMLTSVNVLGHFTRFTCYFAFNAFNEAIVVCPNEAISTVIAAIHWRTTALSRKYIQLHTMKFDQITGNTKMGCTQVSSGR